MVADRLAAAMDVVTDPATGNPTCRSNIEPGTPPPDLSALFGLPVLDAVLQYPTSLFGSTFTPGANSGCVPFNAFSPTANNKASIQFWAPSSTTLSELTQQDLNGFVSFDFPQWQDWGMAGPLSMVLGGEWRQETSKSVSPANTIAGYYGNIPGSAAIIDNCSSPANIALGCVGAGSPYFGQGGPEVRGRFHVSEGFGEVTAPVLADKPFAEELTLHAAGRVSDYSTAGTDETWTMDATWAPISSVKFRGADSYAVRAPNIGELFSPQQVVFEGVTDPCDAADVHAGTAFRVANCTALFKALGVPYTAGTTETTSNVTPQVELGGNPNLKPETARTQTLGVVIQPDILPDLTLTVDWWRVNISNAIEAPTATDIAAECVDLSSISNPFCYEITRAGATPPTGQKPGQITLVTASELNVATFLTKGTDFTASYHANLDDWFGEHYGMLDLHLIGSHLDVFETTPLPGAAPVKGENIAGGGFDGGPTPYWQFNLDALWTFDQWQVDYDVQWYNSILNVTRNTLHSEPNFLPSNLMYVPAQNLHSIQISYNFSDGWQAYAGINNLFYQKPQFTNTDFPTNPLGRVFYAGLKVDMNPW
jgi:outer membrane receptor protein involved in Fe transport